MEVNHGVYQHFIWDFTKDISDKKSLIGVTVSGSGNPVNIHFKDDTKGNVEDIKDYLKWLKPYSEKYIESKIDLNDWVEIITVGIVKFVKKMIDSGQDPSYSNNFAIRYASQFDHTEIVKVLLDDDRVDPSAQNNYAIRWASQNGHTDVVKLLLKDDRVNPSDLNNYAIRWASKNGHTDVVKLLLKDDRVNPSDFILRIIKKFIHRSFK